MAEHLISSNYLDTVRRKYKLPIDECLIRLRDQIAIVPNFLLRYDNRFNISINTKSEYVTLCLLSNYFQEFTPVIKLQLAEEFNKFFPLKVEPRYLVEEYLNSQSDYTPLEDKFMKCKFNLHSRDLYPFLKDNQDAKLRLLSKVALEPFYGMDFVNLLLDSEFITPRKLFGMINQKEITKIISLISFKQKYYPKVSLPNRKRGYNDHGSMRDKTKRNERFDFTFNEYQNGIDFIKDSEHELYSEILKAFQPTGVEISDSDDLKRIFTLNKKEEK